MREARLIAFGDIFLEDVREYRERLMGRLGFDCVFPLWGEPTTQLSHAMIAARIKARIVCVDTNVLSAGFAGRPYDADLLRDLPSEIDPCGERGKFHTFVSDGPGFKQPVEYRVGEVVLREERFAYCDLIPEAERHQVQNLPGKLAVHRLNSPSRHRAPSCRERD
jgi:diphthamide synthase (EF-2-diphthine--ammonia ligase)